MNASPISRTNAMSKKFSVVLSRVGPILMRNSVCTIVSHLLVNFLRDIHKGGTHTQDLKVLTDPGTQDTILLGVFRLYNIARICPTLIDNF